MGGGFGGVVGGGGGGGGHDLGFSHLKWVLSRFGESGPKQERLVRKRESSKCRVPSDQVITVLLLVHEKPPLIKSAQWTASSHKP